MKNEDTIKLLKECDAGTKTAVNSINQVRDDTQSDGLKQLLQQNLKEHEEIGNKTHSLLNEYDESGKDPSTMARSMSWMTTSMKLMANNTDHTVADLMMDGCNMGIKKVSEYINKYQDASSESVDLAKRLIKTEQKFMDELRVYL